MSSSLLLSLGHLSAAEALPVDMNKQSLWQFNAHPPAAHKEQVLLSQKSDALVFTSLYLLVCFGVFYVLCVCLKMSDSKQRYF